MKSTPASERLTGPGSYSVTGNANVTSVLNEVGVGGGDSPFLEDDPLPAHFSEDRAVSGA